MIESNQPIDERLTDDLIDPNFSAWRACIAVKAAQLQGEAIGEAYVRSDNIRFGQRS